MHDAPMPDRVTLSICDDARRLGPSLRNWRALRRVKQQHAAELLGVAQSTISRWENGALLPEGDERDAVRTLLRSRLDSAGDRALGALVNRSTANVHLVCDLTHTLLAMSAVRARECEVGRDELVGQSLWRHASDQIRAAEATLASTGWFDPAGGVVEFSTGSNTSPVVRITDSKCRWTRMQLSDGGFARLVETIPAA